MARRLILWVAAIMIVLAVVSSLVVQAMTNNSQYRSYTKTIKSCDSQGNCMMRDLLVQCLDDIVLDITLIGESPDIPESFEGGDVFSWCE